MTLLHIVPSLLFVLLVPLQFVSSLRAHHPSVHRWTGRVTLSLGVVLGGSALWLSAHPVGGLAESTATIFFACLFLFALGKAWRYIRNGRVELHREWATRMGHAHDCHRVGRSDYTADHGRLLRDESTYRAYTARFLRAGDVAGAPFDLSCWRGMATNAENWFQRRGAKAPRRTRGWCAHRSTLV